MEHEIFLISIFLLSNITIIYGNLHEKCCKSHQHIIEQSGTLLCEVLPSDRLQDNFNKTGFLDRSENGSCIEIFSQQKVSLFSSDINTKKIVKTKDLEMKYFPKCCPLGYRYNKTIHSCTKKDDDGYLKLFLKDDSFVKIGLPECNVISDRILFSNDAIEIGEDGITLKEMGENLDWGKFCIDYTLDGKLLVRLCEEYHQICGRIRCINKCCPDGQSYVNGSKCRDTFVNGVDLHVSSAIEDPDEPFALTYGIHPPLFRLLSPGNHFVIDDKGVFSAYKNTTGEMLNFQVREKKYCIEHLHKGKFDKYTIIGGEVVKELEMKYTVTRWVKVVSCIFLILTIVVYLVLPRMRNLFGKILLSYCTATLFFFSLLAYSQFSDNLNDKMCKIIGYCSVVTNIWSFTWMHIMCIDIWLSFGTARTLAGPLQKNEWKRFFQYSIYGWGFSLIWVLLIYVFNTTSMLPSIMHPVIGINKCYLEHYDSNNGSYAYLFFITLPLMIQQIINTVLFVKTIRYCLRIKAEIQRMNDTRKKEYDTGKERLGLLIKLAVVMGVTFLFETVSSIYNFQNTRVTTVIEVIGDSINCSQGVFIFIIFICKRKVYSDICEKILLLKSRKTSISSTATTQISLQNMGGYRREKTP